MPESELAQALDLLVDRWERAGSPVRAALRPAPPRGVVERHLTDLGLNPTDELVDLYAWHDGVEGCELFWETDFHSLADATEEWRLNQSLAAEDPDVGASAEARLGWPGPPEWFPALYMDGSELLVLDNSDTPDRGSVWFTFTQSESERLFGSLLEGVLGAVWCIETGLWRIEDGTRVVCDRGHMPWAHDRVHPPWCAEHH